ncbi:MAG: acyltransferase family protein [Muribaculaceae bacterium]|nr:acyltransferase family protein [Muribaculaceae bacterium]
MKSRDAKIDGLKFLMIYCVVLAHIRYNDYGLHLTRIIFSFHMPVFVFLSGYLTSLHANATKQSAWLKQTLMIFLFAQIAHSALSLCFSYAASYWHGEPFNTSLLTWKMLIVPAFTLWYLICLVYWRLTLWLLPRYASGTTLLIISVFLALASGFVPIDRAFAFQRAFAFFPFFVVGVMFKKHNLTPLLERIGVGYAIAGIIICWIVAWHLPVYMPAVHYDGWHDLAMRSVQTVLAMCLCLMIYRLSRCVGLECFSKWGTYTLWIYIGHSFLIIISRNVFNFLNISFNVFVALGLAAFFCALCIAFAYLWGKKVGANKQQVD